LYFFVREKLNPFLIKYARMIVIALKSTFVLEVKNYKTYDHEVLYLNQDTSLIFRLGFLELIRWICRLDSVLMVFNVPRNQQQIIHEVIQSMVVSVKDHHPFRFIFTGEDALEFYDLQYNADSERVTIILDVSRQNWIKSRKKKGVYHPLIPTFDELEPASIGATLMTELRRYIETKLERTNRGYIRLVDLFHYMNVNHYFDQYPVKNEVYEGKKFQHFIVLTLDHIDPRANIEHRSSV
jgi:hypothetical protein